MEVIKKGVNCFEKTVNWHSEDIEYNERGSNCIKSTRACQLPTMLTNCTTIYCAALNMEDKLNSSPSRCCHNHSSVFQSKGGKWFIGMLLSMLWEYINTSLDHRGSIIKIYKTSIIQRYSIKENTFGEQWDFDILSWCSNSKHPMFKCNGTQCVLADSIFCGKPFWMLFKILYVEC